MLKVVYNGLLLHFALYYYDIKPYNRSIPFSSDLYKALQSLYYYCVTNIAYITLVVEHSTASKPYWQRKAVCQ